MVKIPVKHFFAYNLGAKSRCTGTLKYLAFSLAKILINNKVNCFIFWLAIHTFLPEIVECILKFSSSIYSKDQQGPHYGKRFWNLRRAK